MNMRKIIAVLSAVLMLCAIIPMGAMVSAATQEVVVYNADFEDGTAGTWKSADETNSPISVVTPPVANPNGGTYAIEQTQTNSTYSYFSERTALTLETDTDYVLSVDILSASANHPVGAYVATNYWLGNLIASTVVTPSTTEWTTYTLSFNSGSNVTAYLGLKDTWTNATVYFDNVKLAKVVTLEDAVFPENAIYTETFESASLNGWSSSTSSIVETSTLADLKADGGIYAMQFVSTSYSYTNYQLTVEPNTDYKVTYSILSGTNGYPINARIRGNNEDLALLTHTPGTGAWETHSYVFNSGDYTSVGLRFQAGWETGTYYIDNLCVVPFDMSTMSDDGHVLNGDFETGDSLGWLASANTEVVADPTGADQGYVIKTSETGSAVDMFTQTFKNLVAGKTYTISFKVYGYGTATNNAFYVRIPKDATFSNQTGITAGSSGKTYIARYNLQGNTGAWYTATLDFVPAASTALIQFQNYRSGQGFYYFDDITLSHVYDAVVTDPTCEEAGYTTYTCACGATYTEAGADALGHTAGDPADCVNAQTCTVCGEVLAEALGHTAGDSADCENAQVCTVCGEVLAEALGHTYDYDCDAECNVCGATREAEHSYFYPCDPVCQICYEITNPDATHNIVAVEAVEATCTENGNIAYWYCADCGQAWADEALTQITNQRNVIIPAAHTYTDNCDFDCDVCGEYRDAPHNLTTYVEAVVPANCQEEGYNEYWICEDCGGYFCSNGVGGYYETNPAWMYYTGGHVRPEGAAACAVVACELCGEDSYGTEVCVRPEGDPVCQESTCVNCGGYIWGEGCTYGYDEDWNPLSPFCQPGDCVYCGTHYEYLYECENGSYAPCSVDGECVYGCGKQYPATGIHAVDNPCEGGTCWQCWETIAGTGHSYDNDFDVDCNVCGGIREAAVAVVSAGTSASEDVSGVAALFDADVEGMAVVDGTKYEADYANATVGGYQLIGMGAVASNSKSSLDIPCVYLWDVEAASYAIRVKNIPAANYDDEITFVPYVIVEIDGEEVTINGEPVTVTYNGVIG